MTLANNQFVFQRVLKARELGDTNLVAVRLEDQSSNDIRNVRPEFAPLNRMPPQLPQRAGLSLQQAGHLCLTTRHKRNRLRFMAKRETDRVIGRRVASMERRHHVDAPAL